MNTAARAALAAALVAFAATAAFAVPDPFNSTWPSRINIVAAGPGGAGSGPGGEVQVTYRDLAANPVPDAPIVFDFSACPGLALAVDQPYPGLTVDCALRTVTAMTDVNGVATFRVVGRGVWPAAADPCGAAKIYAEGVLFGGVNVGIFDRDGVNGVTLSDLSLWTADYFSATNPCRSNYDDIGGVDLLDLTVWGRAYFNGTNAQSAANVCP